MPAPYPLICKQAASDAAEQKCSSEDLGKIVMTRPVRISLGILRAYLILMTLMLGYHVLDLGGVFHAIR